LKVILSSDHPLIVQAPAQPHAQQQLQQQTGGVERSSITSHISAVSCGSQIPQDISGTFIFSNSGS
jgi:hypothetical protein